MTTMKPIKEDDTIPRIWHDSIIRQLESKPHFAYARKFVPLFKKSPIHQNKVIDN